MAERLKAYHRAWLRAHPERTAEWLLEHLRDGFHVHHVDGDHGNNDPRNLVLIEGLDHFMLHSGGRRAPWEPQGTRAVPRNGGPRRATLARGQAALSWKRSGLKWREVARILGCSTSAAMSAAARWREHQAPASHGS